MDQREIKFMVWDKQYKEFGQQFIKIVKAEDGTEFTMIAFKFSWGIVTLASALAQPREFITLQFTGELDHFKNPIYEGAIIKRFTREGVTRNYKKVVKWVNNGATVNGWNFTKGDQFEIVGHVLNDDDLGLII